MESARLEAAIAAKSAASLVAEEERQRLQFEEIFHDMMCHKELFL